MSGEYPQRQLGDGFKSSLLAMTWDFDAPRKN